MKRVAVVLMNLGGPNNEAAVQPFLYNLFMDDDIFKIPLKGKVRSGLMKWVTTSRAKKVSEKYKEINACPQGCLGPKNCSNRINQVVSDCCSSTNPITEWQRRSLEKMLKKRNPDLDISVHTAMRYWNPGTDFTLDELSNLEVDEVILLPLYPQFSYTTTASSFNEWTRRMDARNLNDKWITHRVINYHLHPLYLQAINKRIDEGLKKFEDINKKDVHLLFSAHGTPISFRDEGDPYSLQIRETMEAVMEHRSKDLPYWLSYQSRVGPVKWLEPNTEAFLKVLRGYGIKHILVIPIAFVSDHIETLHEIGIEFLEVAEELGIEEFYHTEGLNDMPMFIECLSELVEDKIKINNPDLVSGAV